MTHHVAIVPSQLVYFRRKMKEEDDFELDFVGVLGLDNIPFDVARNNDGDLNGIAVENVSSPSL